MTPADVQKVLDALKIVSDTLKPHLQALTPKERQVLPKMGDGTLPFVQKALDYAITNAQFVPGYIDVPELKVDVDAVGTLLNLVRPMSQVTQNLDDTTMLCGSEAYVAALAIYNSVKQAAKMKVPGAQPIYEDLKQRFDKASQNDEEPPKTT